MSMTDPIADLLTRIRNANKALFPNTTAPYSKLKEQVVKIMAEEGYIRGYEVVGEGIRKSLVINLKYTPQRERVIEGIQRISKPGKRVYVKASKIKPVKGGLGVAILSTPKGVVSNTGAVRDKVGGEWLCSIW